MKGQFEKYVNTIRKSAWYYAKVWGIEFEEVESQGYLIYCQCLESFDTSKNCKFNTYLTSNLRTLNDFCITYKRQQGTLIDDYSNEEFNELLSEKIKAKKPDWSLSEILENAQDFVSNKAYSLLEWILNRDWEKYTDRSFPSIRLMSNVFQVKRNVIEQYLSEIKKFYHSPIFNI